MENSGETTVMQLKEKRWTTTVAKMFEKLKRFLLCNRVRHPIDELIALTAEQKLSIWNGVNYCGEFMFRYPAANGVQEWGSVEKTPWLQVRFGNYTSGYGDWGGGFSRQTCPMVRVLVDEEFRIVDVERESPYLGHPVDRKLVRKLDGILARIKRGDRFTTANTKLVDWLGKLFAVPVEKRYAHYVSIDDVMDCTWEQKKWLFA